MGEFSRNVWAPWRMQYIESLSEHEERGCFLCRLQQTPREGEPNHVLRRNEQLLMLLNRFPYTTGHLLVAPTAHVGQLDELPEEVLCEMTLWLCDAKRVLEIAFQPQGFNIGMNVGRCAGAGLPDHVHWHIVPRWAGDTNFMPLLGDVRVIPEALDKTYDKLLATARQLGW